MGMHVGPMRGGPRDGCHSTSYTDRQPYFEAVVGGDQRLRETGAYVWSGVGREWVWEPAAS